MPSTRRPLTDKQREAQSEANAQIKVAAHQDALRRRAADEEFVKQQEAAKSQGGRSGPLVEYHGGSSRGNAGNQTANYQKHTLIALTSAFLITMFTTKIAGTVGKVKSG